MKRKRERQGTAKRTAEWQSIPTRLLPSLEYDTDKERFVQLRVDRFEYLRFLMRNKKESARERLLRTLVHEHPITRDIQAEFITAKAHLHPDDKFELVRGFAVARTKLRKKAQKMVDWGIALLNDTTKALTTEPPVQKAAEAKEAEVTTVTAEPDTAPNTATA